MKTRVFSFDIDSWLSNKAHNRAPGANLDNQQNQSVDPVGAAQVEEQIEKEAVDHTIAAPAATVASAASNPGCNHHGFYNQAARSTTDRLAPIPEKYFEASSGLTG
ncbi:hypothetical protein OQJ13_02670 [Legionella sp. PATHC035]|uniref:hypothetical protein n=1 Tax=Legionella sp. PATHC035 TaxID=2992040 RepID=UPI0022446E0A|nr:hypothetical protein [Legionella sp. PATHC035]MCW8407871.1 hypothetical protein [Legionella sp. PATHC035]